MTEQTGPGVVARQGLSASDLDQIRRLADLCDAHDRIALKLNWDDLQIRPADETNDFLYYEQGALIGFLGLYTFGALRGEISGMVHPDHRRRGVASALLRAVQDECTRRGIQQRLLICDRASRSGAAFATAIGASLAFSEHKMQLDPRAERPEYAGAVRLRQAQRADVDALAHILAISFGGHVADEEGRRRIAQELESGARQFYLGEVDGAPIGALNLSGDGEDIGIYGFGVLPEQRGRGYGRQMLNQAIDQALTQHPRYVTLEVETLNNNALALYQSCGFIEVATYDYYGLKD